MGDFGDIGVPTARERQEPEHYQPTQAPLQKVKEVVCWAYRNGYCGAEQAGEELARHLGERLTKSDLGLYGDTLEWQGREEVFRG